MHARLVGREQRRRRKGCGAHLGGLLGLAPLLLKDRRVDLSKARLKRVSSRPVWTHWSTVACRLWVRGSSSLLVRGSSPAWGGSGIKEPWLAWLAWLTEDEAAHAAAGPEREVNPKGGGCMRFVFGELTGLYTRSVVEPEPPPPPPPPRPTPRASSS
eukprot:scaffold596_cov31-Phaeocystis_antarctica.AAC.2